MKIGDSFRVSERRYRKQDICKVSQGKIDVITPGGITILKENGTRETFNIGDLMNRGQKKEIYESEVNGWEEVEGRKEGNKCVLRKKPKSNN